MLLDSIVTQDFQIVIATHSPIIMGYADAQVYSLSDAGIHPIAYEGAEYYRGSMNVF